MFALLVFAAAAGATLYFNYSMSGGMPMPGNWTMSMMWMPMGSVFESATVFIMMWLAMMIAMMLPSTMSILLLYRRAAEFRGETISAGRCSRSAAATSLYGHCSESPPT